MTLSSSDLRDLPDDVYRQIVVAYIDGLERRLDAAETELRNITRGHYQQLAADAQFQLETLATEQTNRANITALKARLQCPF